MGAELLQDDEVSALCDKCSSSADVDLRHLLTAATDDELRLTQNAQPALAFMGVGLTLLLARAGHKPEAAAGHSVGEYGALAAAGAVEPQRVMKAVLERGKAMADAAPAGTSSMSAVLGLDAKAVEVALALVQIQPCPNCKHPHRPHSVCPNCGQYAGREVIKAKG